MEKRVQHKRVEEMSSFKSSAGGREHVEIKSLQLKFDKLKISWYGWMQSADFAAFLRQFINDKSSWGWFLRSRREKISFSKLIWLDLKLSGRKFVKIFSFGHSNVPNKSIAVIRVEWATKRNANCLKYASKRKSLIIFWFVRYQQLSFMWHPF